MHNYKKLQIWSDAMDIAVAVYALTNKFPKEETYEITQQLRRSAISVPSNIAEGSGRNTKGEFNQFLGYSVGSSYEVETQLIVSESLNYCSKEEVDPIIEKININQKMIYNLKET
ncbi:MAG: four helix bundle protein [Chitinophagales bacterium]|nr:four helix bundle protein [Chitinophagales bacterium]